MRFQTCLLAAVAAASAYAQAASSATSAAQSAASSVVSSAVSGDSSSSASASSSASSASTSSESSASSVTSSATSASASASSSTSSDDEEQTTTRVYTTTYYYLKHNPTYAAVSPTLLVESVVKSTSGQSDQQTFSTPSDAITVLSVTLSTYTTTWTSANQYDAVSPTLSGTKTVTTTIGIPDLSTTALNAGAGHVAAGSVGGIAAFFLGAVALL